MLVKCYLLIKSIQPQVVKSGVENFCLKKKGGPSPMGSSAQAKKKLKLKSGFKRVGPPGILYTTIPSHRPSI